MIVVVEGPDGAGKSTLCEQLMAEARLRRLDVKHVHSNGPGTYSDYLGVLQSGGFSSQLVIADRLHYGELVYGITRRQYPNISLRQAMMLDEVIQTLKGKVVVLVPPLQTLLDRHEQRGEAPPPRLGAEAEAFKFITRLLQMNTTRTVHLHMETRPHAKRLAAKLLDEVTR